MDKLVDGHALWGSITKRLREPQKDILYLQKLRHCGVNPTSLKDPTTSCYTAKKPHNVSAVSADGRTDGRTDGQGKRNMPPATKVAEA